MLQSDHKSNFHNYVIISVHIFLYFVSVAQFFAKLILVVLGLRCHVSVVVTIKEGPYRTTTVWDTISDLPQIKIGAAK